VHPLSLIHHNDVICISLILQNPPKIYLVGIISPIPKDEYQSQLREVVQKVLINGAKKLEDVGITITLPNGKEILCRGTIHSLLGGVSVLSLVLEDPRVTTVVCEMSHMLLISIDTFSTDIAPVIKTPITEHIVMLLVIPL
jgi:hypothetical protein